MVGDINIINKLLINRKDSSGKNENYTHRAALVRRHNIIIAADNYIISNRNPAHAEATVLSKLLKNRDKKYDMYVVRTSKGYTGGNSQPCYECLQCMAASHNINRIVYTDGESIAVTTVNKLLNTGHHHVSKGQKYLLEEENEDDDENL